MSDENLSKKLLQERLDCINQTKLVISDEYNRLSKFCIRCSEDRIFCSTCVIPLTVKKLSQVI